MTVLKEILEKDEKNCDFEIFRFGVILHLLVYFGFTTIVFFI